MAKKITRRGRKLARARKDILLHWYKSVPSLEDQAFAARQRSSSYRKFEVGSAAIGVLPDGTFREYAGANRKERKGPRTFDDQCAEMEIIDAARKTQCVELAGMVTVAPHQPDDFRDIDLGVTICCVYCRRRFVKELQDPRSPLKRHTRMIFVNADDRTKRVELTVEKVLLLCE